MDEFRFTDESPACSADACGIFERLEAILAELRALREDLKPKPEMNKEFRTQNYDNLRNIIS